MNKDTFKSILINARHAIVDAEERTNQELQDAFHNYYDELAPLVFPPKYSRERLKSSGFKLYVQQVLGMVYALDETTEKRNKPINADFTNVVSLSEYRLRSSNQQREYIWQSI